MLIYRNSLFGVFTEMDKLPLLKKIKSELSSDCSSDSLLRPTLDESPMPMPMPIGAPRNVGCFAGGTLVWTDKGAVPIEQIQVGDVVLSRSGTGGTMAHRAVTRVFVREDKEVFCLRYVDPARPTATYTIYPTGNHPFWVKSAGWVRVDMLHGGEKLQLQDERLVEVRAALPIYRTSRFHIGWYNTSRLMNDIGHEVDFSGAPEVIDFEAYSPDELDEPNPRFKVRAYDLEVAEFNTYYVGYQGVWVHSDH